MQESNLSKIKSFEKKLFNNPVPVLNNTLLFARKKISKEQFRYDSLEELFVLDPMCLFNFLTYANQYAQESNSAFKETVKTPKHASMLLGVEKIESCISSLSTLNLLESHAVAIKIEQIALRSLHCAYQARAIAEILHCNNKDEIFLNALMMSLAELFIWFVEPEKAQQYEQIIYMQSVDPVEAQHRVFGFGFTDLMVQIKTKWRLPKLYIKALKTESLEEAKKSIICIRLADKLSRLVDFGWYYRDVYEHIDYCALIMNSNTERLAKQFHHVAVKMSRDIVGFYKTALPVYALALQAGRIPYYPVLRLKNKVKPKSNPNPVKENNSSSKKTLNVQLQKLQDNLGDQLKTATKLPQLISLTINCLYDSDNFDQVILLMLNKSKKSMTVSIEKTRLENSVKQKKITILPDKNLFSLLLEKHHPININKSNYKQYKKLITHHITDVLPAKEFFAKGIFYKNKPIGIIYVANGVDNQTSLDADNYKVFNQIQIKFENQLSLLV